jgi:hypothetical protein
MNKRCKDCNEEKDLSEFSRNGNSIYNSCKACRSRYNSQYHHTHYDKVKQRDVNLRNNYGISLAEYEAMFQVQAGRCGICQNAFPKLHVDHDHETNQVRGLLCGNCNRMIGQARHDEAILVNAIRYLERYKP